MLLIVLRKNSKVENQNFGLGNFTKQICDFQKIISDMVMKVKNGQNTNQFQIASHVCPSTEIIRLANEQVPKPGC